MKKYLPANRQFENYALKDIVQLKESAKQSDDQFSHFGKVMYAVLNYILVGKEKEAWAFYDEYYKQNDESKSLGFPEKEKIKASIKKELRTRPLYRFIYRGKKQG